MANMSKERVTEYLRAIILILHENGGSLSAKKVIEELEARLKPNTVEKYEYKGGGVRWIKVMQFSSIGLVKAGWLRKKKGVWYITEEGEMSLTLEPDVFRQTIDEKYRQWAQSRNLSVVEGEDLVEEAAADEFQSRNFEQAQNDALEEIKNHIRKLDPYEFQDLVAALFRGMGYYTPFIAPKGPDGGIDVVAYKDPIGAESPRIRIQVKHRPDSKIGRPDVQALSGSLHRDGYIGIIVSSGGFTPDAISEIRTSGKHMEKMDLDSFIELWEQHYEKMTDEDKQLLPLRAISFLAPQE
ncbi:MAG: hypothetical protein Athens041674_725 [Parcubacteria group bacterium Athens0416_74]|nr:MAG: hypothetical protein Athens041674_725 [Parcubacteria group bacterium Athens0416_74]